MNIKTYNDQFDAILSGKINTGNYSDPHFVEYTKLNASRSSRWMKKGVLLPETITFLKSIKSPQHWILITEHWCGDAAHITPFIALMAEQNELIELDIELRDETPFRINKYLTNGGKSIPILIVQDENGKDLFVWGPRPTEAQALAIELKNSDLSAEEKKIPLQNWYNKDKGVSIQYEIVNLLINSEQS